MNQYQQPVVERHRDLLVATEVCRSDYFLHRASGEAFYRMNWITTFLTAPPRLFRTIAHSVEETAMRRSLRQRPWV